MFPRLTHDMAWQITLDVFQVLGESLTDEQKADVFPHVYHEVREGLNLFVLKREREWQRLNLIPREVEPPTPPVES